MGEITQMNSEKRMTNDQLLSNYDYELPPELIAQTPAVPRDSSRLLVVDSPTSHAHSIFHNLPDWLLPGDLLVLNNTRVIPARLYGHKSTGAPVEILLLEEQQNNCWLALVKPGKRLKLGAEILFYSPQRMGNGAAQLRGDEDKGTRRQGGQGDGETGRRGDGENFSINNAQSKIQNYPATEQSQGKSGEFTLKAKVIDRDEATGGRILQFQIPPGKSFWQLLDRFGQMPLPPYIRSSQAQPSQYQTVYAQQPGAVAAPTAGLHFTDELLQRLQSRGIKQAYVTLHVGVGTFRPVEIEDITAHAMHQEWLEVTKTAVEQIEQTKARGGRIIAVGTTAVRALEGAANAMPRGMGKLLFPFRGKTDLFIYPGYRWRVVDGLITNFHLPRSSLLMLVSALVGRGRLLALYQEAMRERYRFYSFGDAMLILPAARE